MPGCSLTVSNENGFLNFSIKEIINKITTFNNREFTICSSNSKELFETIYSDKVVYPEYFKTYE